MIDDYKYTSFPLPSIPDEKFGYGAKSDYGLGTTIGPGYDQPGINTNQDFAGAGGGDVYNYSSGGGYIPPGASYGAMLWYNGSAWTTLAKSTATGGVVLKQDGGTPYWERLQTGYTFGDILYWDGGGWQVKSAPTGTGTFVLSSNGGTLSWLATESC